MMKRVFYALISVFMIVSNLYSVYAEDSKVIKVGYPIQSGITQKDGTGYTVDYLNEMKKYIGWEYEYVRVDGDLNQQLTTLLTMLQKGEIDLMGAMNYNEALSNIYDYPTDSYGNAYTALAVQRDDARWLNDDYAHWNHMKVGVYPSLKARQDELEKFADLNGFTYTIKEYDNYDEVLKAIENQEIDATLHVDISLDNKLRSIAKFSPRPFYFATTKGNTEIIRKLNNALESVSENNPYLKSKLYTQYFKCDEKFMISQENKSYIESLGTLDILYFNGNKPLHYYESGKDKGISIDYLEKMSTEIGLKYNLTAVDSYQEANELLKQKKVDMILGLPVQSNLISTYNMKVSQPYFTSQGVEVTNNKSIETISNQVVYNSQDILKSINKGEESAFYIDSYITQHYINPYYSFQNLYVNHSHMTELQYVFSFDKNLDIRLQNIINSYINSFVQQDLQKMIYANTNINMKYTLSSFVRQYIWQISFACLFVLLIFAILYLKIMQDRNKYQNILLLQNSRFTNFSSMLDECIFEYDYSTDILQIQNNRILFSRQNHIEHFLENYPDHYIAVMIQQKEDLQQNNMLLQDGKEIWHRTTIKIIRDKHEKAIYAIGRIINIHDDVLEKEKLVRDSHTDSLTQLYNRQGAKAIISEVLKEHEGCMMIIDIDNFKRINDTYGHPVGDDALKRLSEVIIKSFRKDDIKCRLGGDEFMIFLPSLSQSLLQKRLRDFIELAQKEVFQEYSDLQVSMSIGISTSSRVYQELYIQADEALYKSKKFGKNRYYIYKPTL